MKAKRFDEIVKVLGSGCAAYVANSVINEGLSFQDACDNENLYGDKPFIVVERNRIAAYLGKLGYSVEYKA